MDESPALSAGAGRVPAAWLKLSPHAQLKPGQVDTLEAIASGGDLVSRQATGSGKSLTFMLPAVAGWQSGFAARQRCRDAQERAELPLPSLVLVLVPFVELMLDLQREADEYFAWLFETGRTPVRLRALAVIRSQAAPASAANLATTLPCAAEPVAATAAPDAAPVATAGDPPFRVALVAALPCGRCSKCTAGVPGKCWWCCRVEAPGQPLEWCPWCRSAKGTGLRVVGCGARKRVLAGGAPPARQ